MAVEPDAVKVRAILTTGFGGQVKGIGIPLPTEGAEERSFEEEPTEEEPRVEERTIENRL